MRFSLRTLLLLFPALIVSYALAYGCAMQAEHSRAERPQFTWFHEYRNVRFMHIFTEREIPPDEQASMQSTFNAYFSGNMISAPKKIAEFSLWIDAPTQDSWGNPYRCVLVNNQLHFYSCGEDGISRSNGNDPDDLNSWSDENNKFYREQYSAYKHRQRHLESLCYFPVTLGLVFGGWVLARRLIMKKFCRPAGACDSSSA